MNDNLICDELAAVLSGDPVFLAKIPHIHGAQSGDITDRPSLVITGTFTPYGPRRKGMLMLELKSRLADNAALELAGSGHADLFAALYIKLFGAAEKVALKSLILGRWAAQLTEYGPAGADPIKKDTQGDDLVTVLEVSAAWQFL